MDFKNLKNMQSNIRFLKYVAMLKFLVSVVATIKFVAKFCLYIYIWFGLSYTFCNFKECYTT